jgi:hypothetical protein
MNDKEFWAIVAECDWGKDFDYERIKSYLMEKFTLEQASEFAQFISDKTDTLTEFYDSKFNGEWYSGDDGFSDLRCHIVGLGEDEFNRTVENVELMRDRWKEFEYEESFWYAIPSEYDYTGKFPFDNA